ncbi:MAG: glycosyltransferase [Candidatus Symbiothrix sp.]|jgi:glycosyltransferase involved in cell wall biosynthesis|nr:glycosyltransferase [Candidatus Symbiothrix sp.]
MEHKTLISVIIPVYNGEKYLAQCIENTLCQTYKQLEIIVIDDGSTDKSAQIAAQYPVKIISQKNSGLAASRNTGIDNATGDYIHFLDVDDWLNLQYYEKMLEAVQLTKAEMAVGGVINEIRQKRTQIFDYQIVVSTIDDKLALTNVGKYGYAWRYLFDINFLKNNNLRFEEGRLIEDLAFSLQAVYFANKIVSVPNAVYVYKLRENSIMSNRNKAFKQKRHEDWKHAKEVRRQFAEEHHFQIPDVATKGLGAKIIKWFA